jgi:hypothetical protein
VRELPCRAHDAFLGEHGPSLGERGVRFVFFFEPIQMHVRVMQILEPALISHDATLRACVPIAKLAQFGQIALALLPGFLCRPFAQFTLVFHGAMQHPHPMPGKP